MAISRNLVGRESVAWVQIPPSPPSTGAAHFVLRLLHFLLLKLRLKCDKIYVITPSLVKGEKIMRKSFFIFAILILLSIIMFASCDSNSTPPAHTHSFGEWETVQKVTCTSDGSAERYCSCGEKQTKNIASSGHTEVVDQAVAATCTTSGKTAGKHCSDCNTVIVEQTTVQALGHTEVVDQAVAATCTSDGKTAGKHCSVCDTVIVAQTTIQSPGHQYNSGTIVNNATCIQSGTKKYTCTVTTCRHSYTTSYTLPTYSATELYNQSVQYVGEIVVYNKNGSQLGLGTAFVISSDGKIVTNYHVIDGAYSAEVTINGITYPIAKILAYDENIDLAVLKINANNLKYATICKNAVQTGETVYAIGSSRGFTNTYSQGIITQANRVVDGVVHIQHDASITNGNSGGPLLNVYGEVIGINTWGVLESQNLNFAVFTNELDNLVYGTPLTLAEFYELNNQPFDKLVEFILAYGEYNSNNGTVDLVMVDDYVSSGTRYEITIFSYNPQYDSVDITSFVASTTSDITTFTGIMLEDGTDEYFYSTAVYNDGVLENRMSGYIEANTFNSNSLVGYSSYEGLTSERDLIRELASETSIYLVSYLEWFVINYLDLTIADFGFLIF